ncbi:MAG TPA: hypothetical protein VKA55_01255 [Gammaproteobacteria bacterium]|nr:hypothetical protein [Gammaproteobacteria bacterium]
MLTAEVVDQARAQGLPEGVAALYEGLEPPLEGASPEPPDPRDREAAAFLWKAGGYRCGITAYAVFFLLGDFVAHARRMRPRRFGSLVPFARSFDFTDRFIKRVTDSGRRPGGLADPEVVRLLRRIQAAHDRIRVPHWMMVHFGFTLVEQLERDLGETDPELLRRHLRYMARLFRSMGLPFAADRELMAALCRGIERERLRWEPCAGPYGRRLLFLGQAVGVRPDREELAGLLPETVRPLFRARFEEMRPGPAARVLARVVGALVYPARRWRNPRPGERPAWAGGKAGAASADPA